MLHLPHDVAGREGRYSYTLRRRAASGFAGPFLSFSFLFFVCMCVWGGEVKADLVVICFFRDGMRKRRKIGKGSRGVEKRREMDK